MHIENKQLPIQGRPKTRVIGLLAVFCLAAPAFATPYGDKAEWVRHAGQEIQTNYPEIDGFMWFNYNKEKPWAINPSEPDVIDAYKTAWGGLDKGVFLDGFPGTSAAPNTSKIDEFEALAGHLGPIGHQDRIGWYEPMNASFPTAAVNAVLGRGSTPYIVWQPYDTSLSPDAGGGPSLLQAIIDDEDYFPFIRDWATAAKNIGQKIEICFGPEMNGNWFSWGFGGGHNGNTPELYKKAFQHVVDIFDWAGASNVDFVWCVNASSSDDFSAAYPGDDYVDRLAMNGFNWGEPPGSPDWSQWRDFERIFGKWDPTHAGAFDNYEELVDLANGKPIMIGEMGSAPEPATLAFLFAGTAFLMGRRNRRSQ